MIKRIISSLFLLVLFGILVYNLTSKSDDANNASLEQNNGPIIVAPEGQEKETYGLKVGEVAPDFKLETLDGKSVNLSDYKGKKVFLNFWATWCPPCKVEMPEIEKFHQEHGDDVVILAVNATFSERGGKDSVNEFIKKNGYTFSILLDPDQEVNNAYQAISIPTTYFIGTDGKIQLPRKVGPMTYDMMESFMKKLK